MKHGCALLFLALTACAHQRGAERSAAIQSQAQQAGWQSRMIRTSTFDLQTFDNRQPARGGNLTVYIEGDGYAWVDGQFPSDDPTPHTPVALQLAMAQPGEGAVAYIGRPCQYTGAKTDPRCTKQVWTDARFSAEAVGATNQAFDQLKAQTEAKQLQLVGYSGGAAIALLVAAQRKDITRIITIAGNLDPQAWASHMKLSPLQGSLDTRKVIHATSRIPQVDFVGGKDRVVPPILTEKFVKLYPLNHHPRIITMPDNGHVCCWVEQWPQLWQQVMQ